MGIKISFDTHSILEKLDRVLHLLDHLSGKVDSLMALSEDVAAVVAQLDVATNEIAARIQRLLDLILAGKPLSEEDKAEVGRVVATLQALGKDPDNIFNT